ncbi:MAG: hypothetical protein ACR2P9_04035 [Gammaproteobacteria bacterium]
MNEADADITEQQAISFLTALFGPETVKLAAQLDTANLNINDSMTKTIGAGVSRLKTLKGNTAGQQDYVASLEGGARLLLCLWIMDMSLVSKLC